MGKWLARLAAQEEMGTGENLAPPLATPCQNRQNPVSSVLSVGSGQGSPENLPLPAPLPAVPAWASPSVGLGSSEDFEERAAILEFDAGMPRGEAETLARSLLAANDFERSERTTLVPADAIPAEVVAHEVRRSRFARLGRADADELAERLALRDREQDDRRLCLECSYLGERGVCGAARSGRLRGVDSRYEPIPDLLQRCPAFGLRKGMP